MTAFDGEHEPRLCFCGKRAWGYDGLCGSHRMRQRTWGCPLLSRVVDSGPRLRQARVIVESFRGTKGLDIALEAADWVLNYTAVRTFTGRWHNDAEWATKQRLGELIGLLRHHITPEDLLVACVAWMQWGQEPHSPHVDQKVEATVLGHLVIASIKTTAHKYKQQLQRRGGTKLALGKWLQENLLEYAAPMVVLHQRKPDAAAKRKPAIVRPDMSRKMRQLWADPEWRAQLLAKRAAARSARPVPEATRQKLREAWARRKARGGQEAGGIP
jgi:hypothetical protein